MAAQVADLVSAAWVETLRESPYPFDGGFLFYGRSRQPSYRARLDRQPRNVYGEVIPRIVTVRRNLRSLGKPRQRPRLPA